ncbi:MAG: hypothetical protein INH41_01735 [Myxococcaceae bacterium]|jgi:hypothetical protein|nr:hypothetical protein [Myxococcaceae bacterium]
MTTMPTPPQLEAAFTQVSAALDKLEGRKIDLLKEPWDAVEKAVIKLLGGPFDPKQMEHQVVALGLATAFARRLNADHQAFWFPSREAAEGASLGFPEALIMLSPFGAVLEALGGARLARLDDVAKDIRGSLAQVKFGAGGLGGGPQRLHPEDYMRFFDPGFVQLIALDAQKAGQTWATPPERLALDVRDAIGRAQKLPAELKKQMEAQLLTALQRMEPGKPLISQAQRAPRVCEVVGLLFGSAVSTGSAPEEFWMDVVIPLLFIGAPETFPVLDGQELEAAKQGIDPMLLFLDVVPYQFKAPDDEGLLGAFPGATLGLPHEGFGAVTNLRLIKVGTAAIKDAVAAFDERKSRAALAKFAEQVRAQTGDVKLQGTDEARQMYDAAMVLLADLKRVVDSGKDVCVRRLTEAEAASEPALALVRQALSAPRIILAT